MKFCMLEIPSYLKDAPVDFDYFKKMPCESFFVFTGNIVVSSLDNPLNYLMKNIKRPAS